MRFGLSPLFAIVLDGMVGDACAFRVAARILNALATPIKLAEHEILVSTSIGITVYPTDASSQEALLRCADEAMYRAKQRGRNNFQLYRQEAQRRAIDQQTLEVQIREAIQHEKLELSFQPQLAAADGHVVGVDSRIGWEGPKGCLPEGDDCLKTLQSRELRLELEQLLLEQTCRQVSLWQQLGYWGLRATVRAGPTQIADGLLVDGVGRALLSSGLVASHLELELGVEDLADDWVRRAKMVRDLRALGLRVCLAGVAEQPFDLTLLRTIEVDALRISASLVEGVAESAVDRAICSSVIELAQGLKIEVIAQGVSTVEQHYFLDSRGCARVQGDYHQARLSSTELESWLGRQFSVGGSYARSTAASCPQSA